jgi:hypothetical protein
MSTRAMRMVLIHMATIAVTTVRVVAAVRSRVAIHGVMFTARSAVAPAVVTFHSGVVMRRVFAAVVVIATGMIPVVMITTCMEVAVRQTTMLGRAAELRTKAVRTMSFRTGVKVASTVRSATAMSSRAAVKLRSAGEALPRVEAEVLRAAGCAVAEAGPTWEAVRSAMLEHPAELMPAVVLRRRLLRMIARAARRGGIASGVVRWAFFVARRWAASLLQGLLEPLQTVAQLLIFGFEFLNSFVGVAGCGLRRRRELRSSAERES